MVGLALAAVGIIGWLFWHGMPDVGEGMAVIYVLSCRIDVWA